MAGRVFYTSINHINQINYSTDPIKTFDFLLLFCYNKEVKIDLFFWRRRSAPIEHYLDMVEVGGSREVTTLCVYAKRSRIHLLLQNCIYLEA